MDLDRIRQRAYDLWLARGCPHGSSEADWFEAERLVEAEDRLMSALHQLAERGRLPLDLQELVARREFLPYGLRELDRSGLPSGLRELVEAASPPCALRELPRAALG